MAEDNEEEVKMKDFYMYKCGHKFHKDCMIVKLQIDPDIVEEEKDDNQDQDIEPVEVIKLPTFKQRKKYVKKLFEQLAN